LFSISGGCSPPIWRLPPDQQMSIILAQKLVVQVQKYSNFVLVAWTLYTCDCEVWVLSKWLRNSEMNL
jgi:hypothetical protein